MSHSPNTMESTIRNRPMPSTKGQMLEEGTSR
jgi:hypothetical protein